MLEMPLELSGGRGGGVNKSTSTKNRNSISLWNGEKCELFVDYFSCSALSTTATHLVVCYWVYQSIHNFLVVFSRQSFLSQGKKLASGVLKVIAIYCPCFRL